MGSRDGLSDMMKLDDTPRDVCRPARTISAVFAL